MKIGGLSAIVSGGASGLGAATARMLVSRGAKVTILDRDEAKGATVAAQLGVTFVSTDVTSEASVEAAFETAEAAHGPSRILVNCAGIAPAVRTVDRDLAPHDMALFTEVLQINLVGSFLVLSRFAARLMHLDPLGEERAVIVNTASIAAFDGQIGHAAYSASKAGIVGMTLPIARELARSRIRVMTIAPGMFETPIVAGLPARARDAVAQSVLHPARMGHPEEFAALIEAIVTNPMLNGETIRIDGAVRMPPR